MTFLFKNRICVSAGEVDLPNPPTTQDLFKKNNFFTDFQNAVILQPLDDFLCPTPEMKARDACVPFLVSKLENKLQFLNYFDMIDLFWHTLFLAQNIM